MTRMMVISLLMMCVTAPSRILPVFFLGDRKLPSFAESLLHYIPYAVLGADRKSTRLNSSHRT